MCQLFSYRTSDAAVEDPNDSGLLGRRCRNRLATHIEEMAGVKLEPGDVRLVPKQSDAYTWHYQREVEYLFSKELDDHEPEAYRKLCREVGISFYAVALTKGDVAGGHPRPGSPSPYGLPIFDETMSEQGGANNDAHLLERRLSMMETSATYDAVTRMQLQNNIWILEQANECIRQETQQQRQDATDHRNFFYRLLEAIDQLNSTVSDIRQENERIMQETQQQRQDATDHGHFPYGLLEAMDQLNATVSDIRQQYITTVNVSMFPKDQGQLF
ncbi:hypothetical protein FGRA07_11393 [Fusarium graminearum]|nr:hypothetical protein FGRA07_11393 [Fusarium graminearum]